ncbi:hypothetical protein Sjap_007803 [Stephania japonica]|uniref:Gnk2-homologous domain-containing protein n=1 Tax=Stephania japonica TaxID=461633 RepID=A0AAP0JNW9_9MAGN
MDFLAKMIEILVMVLAFTAMVSCVPNTNVTRVLCNSGTYTKGDPFATSLAYVLAELETATPLQKSREIYNISPYPNAFAYGHAACNTNLSSADCQTCLGAAKQTIFSSCPSRIGARSVLYDCTIRYEQYPFDD